MKDIVYVDLSGDLLKADKKEIEKRCVGPDKEFNVMPLVDYDTVKSYVLACNEGLFEIEELIVNVDAAYDDMETIINLLTCLQKLPLKLRATTAHFGIKEESRLQLKLMKWFDSKKKAEKPLTTEEKFIAILVRYLTDCEVSNFFDSCLPYMRQILEQIYDWDALTFPERIKHLVETHKKDIDYFYNSLPVKENEKW